MATKKLQLLPVLIESSLSNRAPTRLLRFTPLAQPRFIEDGTDPGVNEAEDSASPGTSSVGRRGGPVKASLRRLAAFSGPPRRLYRRYQGRPKEALPSIMERGADSVPLGLERNIGSSNSLCQHLRQYNAYGAYLLQSYS